MKNVFASFNLVTMAWRNVLRNTRRTAISATAIGIAAMSIVLMFAIITGLGQEMSTNLRSFYTGDIRIRHHQFDEFAHLNPLHLNIENVSNTVNQIKTIDGVISVSPRTTFPASIYQDGENLNARAMGLDMSQDRLFSENRLIDGKMPEPGTREVILGSKVAKDLKLSVGDKFTSLSMTMRRATNGMTFTVVGIISLPVAELNDVIYVPINTVQRFLKMNERAIELVINTHNDADLTNIKQLIQARLLNESNQPLTKNGQIIIEPWDEISESYALIKIAQFVYLLMGLVFYVLASTVIINTMMMVIFERTREIGTLASLGMESKRIVNMFVLEAGFISVIGSFIGVTLGAILVLVLEQTGIDMSQAMDGVDFEISGVIYPKLTLLSLLYAFVSGVIVASLASLIPSKRAAKIKPVDAMSSL